jgi:TetR/AcrR family transcriptional repressor of the ameABC operon
MDEADVLFRQLGFSKTTVADIARELKMSTANIYKFFSSKNALVEACADRRLGKIQIDLRREAGAKKSAADRLLGIILLIYRVHREDFRHERQIHRLVLAATEENWACIRSFKKTLAELVTSVLDETGSVSPDECRRDHAGAA